MRAKKRGLRVLGLMVVALFAMSVVAAAAQAEAWYVGGTRLATGTKQSVDCKANGTLSLSTKVAGKAIVITATTVGCEESTIFNEGSGATSKARDGGKLVFSGLTVDSEIEGCKATSPITTNTLETEVVTSTKFTSGVGDTFVPVKEKEKETRLPFATVKLTTCGAATGSFPVKGSIIGEAENKVGEMKETQPILFSAASNKASKELGDSLTFGTEPAELTGTVINTLVGQPAGTLWGTKAE
jgi:hypothetical protein